ncbi:MAG TPA: adenylate/guanylate cyclase domain-containing protein [Methylomirabilota bacterium]|nr:adenylate/guanylate cyclase domain-containing protein [Methylomirabilota bacterium]
MKCPRCQHDNLPTQKFCGECGVRLAVSCVACGAANAPGQRFCGGCGAGLVPEAAVASASPDVYTPKHLVEKILTSKGALEGERKHVTVLFADVKGSMELLASGDPEDARRILDPVLERMMEAVHRFEGTVNQVMGDGIMALFGAPLALEDHAVRACYASLRMQEAVQRYSDELRRTHGVEVAMRVGLNSGEVVVRSISSDLRMDYSAVGQTTHLAARMEQLARPGGILLTAHTVRLVEGRMDVAPQGEVHVKGMQRPVAAYELKGATAVRSRLEAAAARGLTPFIGRDVEMTALGGAAERAAAGRGQLVAVLGEPGVGKSRVVLEFTRARLEDWMVLEAHAVPYGKESPYLPILELLRGFFSIQPDDDASSIRDRVETKLADSGSASLSTPILALLGLVVDDPEWTRLDARQQRRRTVEAVKYVLLGMAAERAAAIVVEDIHWADTETLAVLDALVDSVAASRLLLIVTYRPEHRHAWGSKTYYRQIALDALPTRDTERLLDRLLGADRTLTPIKDVLATRTGGNPFFLEESVRNLVETGALTGEPAAYRLVRLPTPGDVPATVSTVLAARIDRLALTDKRLLQTASAIGKDVPRTLLDAIADLSADAIDEALARLQASEFLHETVLFPEIEYTFRHALTHEVAYGTLTLQRRRALDARIVAALEAQRARQPDSRHVDRLAHHAIRGEIWDKAVQYGREAGQLALSRHAHRLAAGYFEQAIGALAHLPDDSASMAVAIDLRLELRYALGPLGEYRRVFELLTEARELAERSKERSRLGLISCLLCNLATLRFELTNALMHGARALELADALGDDALATATQGMMSLAHYVAGDYRAAAEAGRRAEVIQAGVWRDRFGLVIPPPVYGASVGSWALAELGEFAEAHRMAARGLAAAEKLHHPHSIAFACLGLALVHLRQGAPTSAVTLLEKAMSLCESADLPVVALEVAGPLASAYAEAGRADAAIALVERAVAQALALRHRLGHVLRSGGMAEALLAAGRTDDAAPLAVLYVQLARSANSKGALASALHLLARIALRSDPPDADTAQHALDECLARATEVEMRPLRARALMTRGELLQRIGRLDDSRTTLAEAAECFRALDMSSLAAKCDALAGTAPV